MAEMQIQGDRLPDEAIRALAAMLADIARRQEDTKEVKEETRKAKRA